MTFWNNVILPLSLVLSLTGYCVYRFRETKAMSLGQFLEMRYNRPLRIFAAALRSLSEMLANMICPAVAARFFIYFLDLPHSFTFLGLEIPTFMVVVFIVLTLAITIICMGGTLALVITDTIQGLLCYPMLVVFTVFVLVTFSWTDEIIPVMADRAAGESFLSPYDISNLRDFNLFALIVTIIATILHRASWIGAGNSSAAKTPHEQKMASVLGTWRTGFSSVFYILLAVTILTLLNHKDFAPRSQEIKTTISTRVAEELVPDLALRKELITKVAAIPKHNHTIGVDTPLSQEKNLDSPYFDAALETLRKGDNGNAKFQEFRTLYNQMMLPMTMRNILPMGMMGLFCLLMVLMMVSTDDSRIYSAALTISQDVIVPFRKKGFTPEQHILVIRIVAIGVGVFFFFGSFFMAQLDYINLFVTIMCSMWLGGCGPVMIFGLYSRFGTSAGAFASLLSGMFLSLGGIFVQRNWADVVYPWLDELGGCRRQIPCRRIFPVRALHSLAHGPDQVPDQLHGNLFHHNDALHPDLLSCIMDHLPRAVQSGPYAPPRHLQHRRREEHQDRMDFPECIFQTDRHHPGIHTRRQNHRLVRVPLLFRLPVYSYVPAGSPL